MKFYEPQTTRQTEAAETQQLRFQNKKPWDWHGLTMLVLLGFSRPVAPVDPGIKIRAWPTETSRGAVVVDLVVGWTKCWFNMVFNMV